VSENLAKARAAARADQPAPTWRLIITDSESPTGLAPVCTGERSDALHMIDDYPGGPQRDEDGVYDCCPWPQIETYSTVWAAYLVELLNADAREEASAQAPTATPDFFQVGHGYTHRDGSDFLCVAVTVHPQTGERLAMGWRVDSWACHYPTTVGINQWNHEYDGVQPPAITEDGNQ
jgi:hypothetical protein